MCWKIFVIVAVWFQFKRMVMPGALAKGFCIIGQLFLVCDSRTGTSQQACIYLRRKRVLAS